MSQTRCLSRQSLRCVRKQSPMRYDGMDRTDSTTPSRALTVTWMAPPRERQFDVTYQRPTSLDARTGSSHRRPSPSAAARAL